jgi:hypothetical protein
VHSKGLIPAPIPRWLEQLCGRVHSFLLPLFGQQPPNHVLINSYQPGCGILVRRQQQQSSRAAAAAASLPSCELVPARMWQQQHNIQLQ